MPKPKQIVRISVDDDDDANRITSVLEALGYEVLRQLDAEPHSLTAVLRSLASRFSLTAREQDILDRVFVGRSMSEVAGDLQISKATVKWHMHNVYVKTDTKSTEELLRLARDAAGIVSGQPTVGEQSQEILVRVDPTDLHSGVVGRFLAALQGSFAAETGGTLKILTPGSEAKTSAPPTSAPPKRSSQVEFERINDEG